MDFVKITESQLTKFHDITAVLLRDHSQRLGDKELIEEYVYKAGLILQKLPFCLWGFEPEKKLLMRLSDLNHLLVDGGSEHWSQHVQQLIVGSSYQLPEKPLALSDFSISQRLIERINKI